MEVGASPAQRVASFVDVVQEALKDDAVAFRMAQAGVLVRLDFTDRPVQPVFLALDVARPYATTEAQPRRADVVLTMTTADLDNCLRQGEELPLRILAGDIRFEGYVRKFLRVLPVLRAAVQACDAARAPAT
ncbi:hypothetical protein [Paraconexibacter sp. AEG42_29]|uniref:hypothetical protein n=1 Tax=Paraconexibacter sp. AEG42_29 TaxID=2997339 RepID=UPI00339D74ED